MKAAVALLVALGVSALEGQSSSKSEVVGGLQEHSQSQMEAVPSGRDLFTGSADLHGRMYLHPSDLPPEVVRCGNCHAVADGPAVKRSSAPRLTAELLTQPAARRGGPPSVYNSSSLCALLRKGTDPAHIVIDVEMPRYNVSDAECTALWNYLTESSHDLK